MNKYPDKLSVSCSCNTPEHELIFIMDTSTGEVVIYSQLIKFNLFKRIKLAIKYIIGTRSNYSTGHWEETTLDINRVLELSSKLLTQISLSSPNNVGKRKLEAAIKELRSLGLPHIEDMKKYYDKL